VGSDMCISASDHDVQLGRRERAQREQRLDGGDPATRDHDATPVGGFDLGHAANVRPPWGASIGTPPLSGAGDYGGAAVATAGIVAVPMSDQDAHTPHTTADGEQTRVVIADDHAVVRAGLRMVLDAQKGIEVVAEVGDAEAAARAVLGHRAHVLVLDLNMPGEPSLEVIPKIVEQSPETAIVVLTMQQDPNFAREALRSGARGYVLKDSANAELVEAVKLAREGRTYLNPEMGARMAAEPPPSGPPDGLTERELEVLRMIALGHTNTEIAAQLYLSVRTVESHRAHIQQKIRRSTRAELVRYALDHKLVEQGE
jgi:two-component system response regulator NreC